MLLNENLSWKPGLCGLLFILTSLILPGTAWADFDMECFLRGDCNRGRSSNTNPSTGGQIRINPSAVPTSRGFGIESILFKSVDVALVQGLGRVGAAISPANSENTFFGPPGIEYDTDFLERKIKSQKFPNQKYTLAAAVSLFERKGSDLSSYTLKLGAMGKYNKYTKDISPGGGISGTLGPLSFGGSYYKDETQLDPELEEALRPKPIQYEIQTYNAGLFLNSVILDYSYLRFKHEETTAEVNLYTASLLWKKFIFTGSKRIEKSLFPRFDRETESIEYNELQVDYFGGVQYNANKHLLVGLLYNYYLLSELSIIATIFF